MPIVVPWFLLMTCAFLLSIKISSRAFYSISLPFSVHSLSPPSPFLLPPLPLSSLVPSSLYLYLNFKLQGVPSLARDSVQENFSLRTVIVCAQIVMGTLGVLAQFTSVHDIFQTQHPPFCPHSTMPVSYLCLVVSFKDCFKGSKSIFMHRHQNELQEMSSNYFRKRKFSHMIKDCWNCILFLSILFSI